MRQHFMDNLRSESFSFTDGESSAGRQVNDFKFINPLIAAAASRPLQITIGGTSRWREGDYWGRRKSSIFGLEIVTAGNAVFTQDGRQHVVCPGQVFLLHKGADHRYQTGTDGYLHKRYVQLEGYLLDQFISYAQLENVDVVALHEPVAWVRLWKEALMQATEKPRGFDAELSVIAFRMLGMLSQDVGASLRPDVRRTLEYIRRNLDRTLTDEDISREAGLGVCSLRLLFKRSVGMTPLQMHLHERMALAGSLLRRTSLSAKEVAVKCGFSDALYFSKVFRRHFGLPPTVWRRAG